MALRMLRNHPQSCIGSAAFRWMSNQPDYRTEFGVWWCIVNISGTRTIWVPVQDLIAVPIWLTEGARNILQINSCNSGKVYLVNLHLLVHNNIINSNI